jgi:type II secretory pathway pseudopilin PulG
MRQFPRQLRPFAIRRRGARQAFSLLEAIVAAAIVAVMLVASLNLLGSAALARGADNDHRTALLLAHQLMGEVQQQPYKDESLLAVLFGPEAGETNTPTRAAFDDVDDYDNYMDKPPQLKDGTPLAGYESWKRKVRVVWVDPATLAESALDTGLKRIEVRVTDPRGRDTAVYALRSSSTTPDPPPSGTSALLWTGIELEAGGETPRRTTAGVPVVTRPTVP